MIKMKMPVLLVTVCAVVGVLIAPSQAATAAQTTAMLRQVLSKRISSPGGQLVIKITPTSKSGQGYFSEVFIAAKPAVIKKRRFSELRLRAKNVRLDLNELMNHKSIVTLSSQTTLRAVITEAEITQALAKGRDSSDKRLHVKFLGDKLRVSGYWHWGWFSGPVDMLGQLKLGPKHTVVANIQSLKLNGKAVPQGLKTKFEERINPLLDYTDLPFRPPFKSIKFYGNKAVIGT